jgi:hypothetical protein
MEKPPALDQIEKLDAVVDLLNEARLTPQFFVRYLNSREAQAIGIVKLLCEDKIRSLIGIAERELELRKKEEDRKIELLKMDSFAANWEASQYEFEAAMITARHPEIDTGPAIGNEFPNRCDE